MVKVKKSITIITYLLSLAIGALICFLVMSYTGKINTKTSLIIKIENKSRVYNGEPLYADSYTITGGSLAEADTLHMEYTSSITDVGTIVTSATPTIMSSNGSDVTSNYNVVIYGGTLTVEKASITVSANKTIDYESDTLDIDLSNVYKVAKGTLPKNMALYPYLDESQIVERDSGEVYVSCKVINTVTNKDETANFNLSYKDANHKVSLTKIPLYITTDSISKVYDGTALQGTNDSIKVSGLYSGDTFSYSGEFNSKTNVYDSETKNSINKNDIKIVDSNDLDVTKLYSINMLNVGNINILTRDVLLTTSNYEKTYDEVNITNNDLSFTSTSDLFNNEISTYQSDEEKKDNITYQVVKDNSIDVNTYSNVIIFEDEEKLNNLLKNYNITKNYGTVTINKADAIIESNDYTKTYDSEVISTDSLTISSENIIVNSIINDETTTKTYQVITDKDINALEYSNEFNISFNEENTSKLEKNFNINYSYGTITINKANATITTDPYTKTYDGNSINSANLKYTINNTLLNSQVNSVIFDNASAVDAGTYENSVTIDENIAKNFDINYSYGTITINKANATITTSSIEKSFDNKLVDATQLTTTINNTLLNSLLNNNYTYDVLTNNTINAGTYANSITFDENITKNFNITSKYGTITINQVDVTITTLDYEKDYDGYVIKNTELSFETNDIEFTNIIKNYMELGYITYDVVSNKLVDADNYDNKLTISDKNNELNNLLTNYNYTITPGVVTINKKDVTITTNDLTKDYDGSNLSNDLSYGVSDKKIKNLINDYVSFDIENKVDAGTYENTIKITDDSIDLSNYNITYVNGTVVINKAKVTITTNDYIKTYDTKVVGSNSLSYDVSNETVNNLIAFNVTFDNYSKVNTGTYKNTITIDKSVNLSNYDITYIYGTITIDKVDVTITTNNYTKSYDTKKLIDAEKNIYNLNYDVKSTTLTDEVKELIKDKVTYDIQDVSTIGTYKNTITIDSNVNLTNYNITYEYGTVTINKMNVDVYFGSITQKVGKSGNVKKSDITCVVNGKSDSTLLKAITFASLSTNKYDTVGSYNYVLTISDIDDYDMSCMNITLHSGTTIVIAS